MSLQCPFLNGGFRPAWKVGGGWEERGAEARQVHRRAGWWGGWGTNTVCKCVFLFY